MDLVSVLLFTLIGTAFGAAAAGFMLWRRTGPPPQSPELPPGDSKSATDRIAELEHNLEQTHQELARKQREYDEAVKRSAEEIAARDAAEQRVQELTARVADYTNDSRWAAAAAARIVELEHSLEQTNQELVRKQRDCSDALKRVAEETAARSAAEQRIRELDALAIDHDEETRRAATLAGTVETQERQIRDLAAEVQRLTGAWNLEKQSLEGKDRYTSSLENELASERARNEEMNQKVLLLQEQCAQLENKLRETNQAAARKLERLSATQDQFSKVFQELCLECGSESGISFGRIA